MFRDRSKRCFVRRALRFSIVPLPWGIWRAPCLADPQMMQTIVKGMVQVQSVTYRIVRVRRGHYDVVRLLDDARVGAFSLGANAEAQCAGAAPELIREIARAALQGGRTSWAPRRALSSGTMEKVRIP